MKALHIDYISLKDTLWTMVSEGDNGCLYDAGLMIVYQGQKMVFSSISMVCVMVSDEWRMRKEWLGRVWQDWDGSLPMFYYDEVKCSNDVRWHGMQTINQTPCHSSCQWKQSRVLRESYSMFQRAGGFAGILPYFGKTTCEDIVFIFYNVNIPVTMYHHVRGVWS